MKLGGAVLTALVSGELAGCVAQGPALRVVACVAAISEGAAPIGQNGDCDLGQRAYIVALPRDVRLSDLKKLGVPENVVLSLTASPPTGPEWCSVTTEAGELPRPDSIEVRRGDDTYKLECAGSPLEIDSPALVEAEAIRIHVKKAEDGKPRVTSVQASRQ